MPAAPTALDTELHRLLYLGNVVGLESLPLEVLEMITEQLSIKDFVACSAICKGWRNTFNHDLFWFKRCNHEIAKYLDQINCIIEPAFTDPQAERNGLSPVCHWRVNFMREVHLWNNWRSGRCQWANLNPAKDMVARLCYKYFSFYEEDFVISVFCNEVEVWDVRGEPVKYFSESPCYQHVWNINFCHVSGDLLLLVQNFVVQVFQINLIKETWQPEQVFYLDFYGNSDINNISVEDLFLSKTSEDHLHLYVADKYLFGVTHMCWSIMFIWNFREGTQISQVTYKHDENWNFLNVISTANIEDVIIIAMSVESNMRRVIVFSLNDMTFYPFHCDSPEYCDLHEEHIVVLSKSSWLVYNFKTGDLLYQIPAEDRSCKLPYELFGNKLLSVSYKGIKQLDLLTGKTKDWLTFDGGVYDFRTLVNRFISLELKIKSDGHLRDMHRWRKGDDLTTEVWDMSDPPRRLSLQLNVSCSDTVKINKSCTKMLLQHIVQKCDVFIINFW